MSAPAKSGHKKPSLDKRSAMRAGAANLAGLTTLMNAQHIKPGTDLDAAEKRVLGTTPAANTRRAPADPMALFDRELSQLADDLGIDMQEKGESRRSAKGGSSSKERHERRDESSSESGRHRRDESSNEPATKGRHRRDESSNEPASMYAKDRHRHDERALERGPAQVANIEDLIADLGLGSGKKKSKGRRSPSISDSGSDESGSDESGSDESGSDSDESGSDESGSDSDESGSGSDESGSDSDESGSDESGSDSDESGSDESGSGSDESGSDESGSDESGSDSGSESGSGSDSESDASSRRHRKKKKNGEDAAYSGGAVVDRILSRVGHDLKHERKKSRKEDSRDSGRKRQKDRHSGIAGYTKAAAATSLTEEEEHRRHIRSVVKGMRHETRTTFGMERERETDIKNSKCEQAAMLILTLEEEGIDCSMIKQPTSDETMQEIDSKLSILRLKNDRNRYSSIAEEVLLGGAAMVEKVFDGTRSVPFLGKPDYTDYSATLNTKLHRTRFETAQVVGNIIEKFNIGPVARMFMEIVPGLLLYPQQRKKQRGSPGMHADPNAASGPQVSDARGALAGIRASDAKRGVMDI
jgi:hypothetical protein